MPHYYDEEQEGPLQPYRISIKAAGRRLELWSAKGIFSKDELDTGTKLLVETMFLQPGWRVHDLGCGSGIVGIMAKLQEPSCAVLCTDVSRRAVELTAMNCKEHTPGIEVRSSDGYAAIPETFDAVLFNPPYVAGRQVIYRLIDEAHEHLNPGGYLELVARHAKGGETLKKRLIEVFGNCDDSRKAHGFRVYIARKDA